MHKDSITYPKILVLLILWALLALAPHIRAQADPATEAKIAPEVQAALSDLPQGQMTTVIVTLVDQVDKKQFKDQKGPERQKAAVKALKDKASKSQKEISIYLKSKQKQGEVEKYDSFWVLNGLSVTATQAVIQEMAARPDVLKITADDITIVPTFAQTAPLAADNLALIQAPALWDSGFYGQGIVVANMDSGVDLNHPDLSSRWRGGSNSWFDPYGQNPMPSDFSGHGTWTMGVMVGAASGGTAIGVAPQAQWIAVKIFNNSGSSTATAIHQGFQWLLDPDGDSNTADAPQVVNNSWAMGSPGCNLEFEMDLSSLLAAGIVPVFAAGNFGPGAGTSTSPANNPSAFAVGGVTNGDLIMGSSSRGPVTCGEATTVFPELVAPGNNILTTERYGLYTTASGTSLAAPHVAGGLALLLSAFPDLQPELQETALLSGAVDLGLNGPDDDYGNGRLDLLAAYQWLHNNPAPPLPTATPTATATATPSASANLALNQPVSVSSIRSSATNGAAAVDGDLATSWQTERSSKLPSEWIKADLGSTRTLDKVVLQWDSNYAKSYTVQVSVDGTNWTTVYSTTSANGAVDTITFPAIIARYVMLDSTAWANGRSRNWLREFEVYGLASASTATPTATALPPTATATPLPPTATATPLPPTATATAGEVTSVHVGDLNASTSLGSRNRWNVLVTITVHNQIESPITGATVAGSWSGGVTGSGSCTTNGSGTCTVSKGNIKGSLSSVRFTVNAVSGSGLAYVANANHDADADSNGTFITVARP